MSDTWFQEIFEGSRDAIFLLDDGARFVEVNRAACDLTGYNRAELLSMSFADLCAEADQQTFRDYFVSVMSGKGAVTESLITRKCGTKVPVELSSRKVMFGRKAFMHAAARDIRGRKRVEDKLRERERQLSTAQQIARLGSWEWDVIANKVSWSDELYRIYGLSQQEFGATYEEFLDSVHPFDKEFLQDVIANALQDHQPFDIYHRIIRPDATVRTVHALGEVIVDQARAIKMVGTTQDVTERRQEEEALRRAEEKYHSIFENAVEGIFQSTPDGRFISVNPAMAEMYGFLSPEEMIAERTDIEHQHYVEPLTRATFKRLLEENGVVEGLEAEVYGKNGSKFWTSENVRAVRDAGGTVLYYEGFVKDITERKQAEEAREQLLKDRERLLSRLVTAQEEERQRIARELHDQLGQQITALMLGIKLLKDSGYCQPQAAQHLSRLQEYADQLGREVHNIAWELRPTALDDLGLQTALGNYLEKWSERSGKKVELHTQGLNGHRLSTQIETTLYRVIQEALTNVRKHASAGCVSLILERRDNHVRAIIEDDGCGFDVEAVMSAPESDRKLGLLGMRERLALVFGTLEIESTRGAGTTLFVRIPTPQLEM